MAVPVVSVQGGLPQYLCHWDERTKDSSEVELRMKAGSRSSFYLWSYDMSHEKRRQEKGQSTLTPQQLPVMRRRTVLSGVPTLPVLICPQEAAVRESKILPPAGILVPALQQE